MVRCRPFSRKRDDKSVYSGHKSAHETRGKKGTEQKPWKRSRLMFSVLCLRSGREGGKDSSLSFGPSVAYALPR